MQREFFCYRNGPAGKNRICWTQSCCRSLNAGDYERWAVRILMLFEMDQAFISVCLLHMLFTIMQFDSQAYSPWYVYFMRNKLTEGNENAHLEICFLFDLQHHLYMTNISAMYFFEEVIFMCLRKLRVFFSVLISSIEHIFVLNCSLVKLCEQTINFALFSGISTKRFKRCRFQQNIAIFSGFAFL